MDKQKEWPVYKGPIKVNSNRKQKSSIRGQKLLLVGIAIAYLLAFFFYKQLHDGNEHLIGCNGSSSLMGMLIFSVKWLFFLSVMFILLSSGSCLSLFLFYKNEVLQLRVVYGLYFKLGVALCIIFLFKSMSFSQC